MTDATDTPQAPQVAAESAAPAIEVAAPAAAPVETKRLLLKLRKMVPPRLALMGVVAAGGLLAGAIATSAYYEFSMQKVEASHEGATLNASVRRLETSVAALSTAVAASARQNSTNWTKVGERFDKVEKSLAEPASRLAALSDSVDKLRATAAASAVKAGPTDVTGTIAAVAKAPAEPQKPILTTWTLHEVDRGIATVEGRQGIFDVGVGDPLPGLDRVEAIRRQDGRWVVVTRKGIIVAR